jgi:hypothetical protein
LQHYIDNDLLMEDGAPMHPAHMSWQWKQAHGIRMLQWPANSLDLNPIENVWKMLKDSINKGSRPNYKKDLVARIHLAWEEISIETLEVLIASMHHRMMAVNNAKGGSTRW